MPFCKPFSAPTDRLAARNDGDGQSVSAGNGRTADCAASGCGQSFKPHYADDHPLSPLRSVYAFGQFVSELLFDLYRNDRWICVDDGSSEADCEQMQALYPFFEFIHKHRAHNGHARSMNLILEKIKTSYGLHLEDNWLFFAPVPFIAQALAILDDDLAIGQVLFNRNYGERLGCQNNVGGSVKFTSSERLRYRVYEYYEPGTSAYDTHMARVAVGQRANAWWPHYSLRPSLLRMSATCKVGEYRRESKNFERNLALR